MQLTSAKNPQLQTVRRAAASGRPTESGLVVAEGPHLVEEALFRGHWRVEHIYVAAGHRDRYTKLLNEANADLTEVSETAFSATAATETSQGILALIRPKCFKWIDLVESTAMIVVLDAIQDPGNAGTIVRSAEAFGASGVVFLAGCARVSNPKLLRATAGSIFRLPFLEQVKSEEFIRFATENRINLYSLSQNARLPVTEANFGFDFALAVGNEGAGVSPELESRSESISIPSGKVESLNAAVACSIALYEASRQRTLP